MTKYPRGRPCRIRSCFPLALVALTFALSACGGGGDDLKDTTATDSTGTSTPSNQHCHTVWDYEYVTEPGYCSGYICFNNYTKLKEKQVCD